MLEAHQSIQHTNGLAATWDMIWTCRYKNIFDDRPSCKIWPLDLPSFYLQWSLTNNHHSKMHAIRFIKQNINKHRAEFAIIMVTHGPQRHTINSVRSHFRSCYARKFWLLGWIFCQPHWEQWVNGHILGFVLVKVAQIVDYSKTPFFESTRPYFNDNKPRDRQSTQTHDVRFVILNLVSNNHHRLLSESCQNACAKHNTYSEKSKAQGVLQLGIIHSNRR